MGNRIGGKGIMKTKNLSNTFTKPKMLAFSSIKVSLGMGTLLMGWVTYFATEHLGLSAATVGILFMISKIFDGFTDLVAGYVIDKCHSKLGKGRPFDLSITGFWICLILMFVVPTMSINLTYAWVFIMYTLANSIFYTLLGCADPVYMANVIDEPHQSISANAVIGMACMVVAMVGGVALPQMAANIGTTKEGWAIIALAIGIPAIAVGMLRFFLVKEKTGRNTGAQQFTMKDAFRVIVHNKYILIVALINLISSAGQHMVQGATNYYCTYVLGDVGLASLMSLAMLSSLFSLILTPIVTKKMGYAKFMRILTIISIAASFLRFINPYNVMLIFITAFFCNVGVMTVWLYISTFIIDCMDYGEWRNGIRSEGSTSCIQSVFGKIGQAIGIGGVGILMGLSGYSGSLTVQPESAINMLIGMFTYIPAISLVIMYVLLRMYNLEEKLPQIRKELAERNGNA